MSLYNDFLKELKKRGLTLEDVTVDSSSGNSGRTVDIGNDSFANDFKKELAKRGLSITDVMEKDEEDSIIRTRAADDDDIAPVKKSMTVQEEDESLLDFFQKGAFKDGYQFGDVTKSILGTAGDVGLNFVKGAANVGEGVADLLTYGMSGVADLVGADGYARAFKEQAKINYIDKWTKGADDFLDQHSVLGRTSDAILQGIGQVGAIVGTGGIGKAAGLGSKAVTAMTTGTMAVSGMGSGMGEAYEGGATDEEAVAYGAISGAADAISELIFGGLGKAVNATGLSVGLSSADDMLAKKVSNLFTNQIAKNFAELGVKASAEGLEEVVAGVAQAWGKYKTYMSEEEFSEILNDENLLEQFVVGMATSGMMQSGIIPGTKSGSLIEANKEGKDFITGYSQNEQAVIKKEIENRIAEQEKDGKKLTAKEKSAIEAKVEADMEKGYISTDTIEEVLGGDTYKSYQETLKSEDAIQKEFDTLNKMKQGEMTGEQLDRRTELKEKLEDIKKNSKRNELKTKLGEEVMSLVQGDRLAESYNERSRRQQAFQADLSQYDEKRQAVIQKAVDSGILNNTNRTHEFVDMIAKISADKGVLFDFTNNAKLKESGFALNGATVNGYKTKDGIVVNVDSAKSRSFVVGHEVTHVLEGTELYAELQTAVFDYAKTKGEYDSKLAAVTELYKKYDPDADPMNELTSDLVGEYLFSDPDFINNLSTEHRNVFQKVYDEIKYLLKIATAGSKEARELEKVKRAFDKAYRETKNTADSGVQYSLDIKHSDGTVEQLADARSLTTEQAVAYLYQAKSGELRRDTYVPVRKDTPQVLIDTLEQVNDHIENLSMVMNVDKVQQAMNIKNPGTKTKKYGDNVRKHGLSPEEVVEIINNLDDPTTVVYQTNRSDKKGNPLPNSVAVFVEYKTDGNEGVAAVEFENPRNTDAIGTEFGETNYHTVITVFEPDIERDGMPFDYVEELLSNPDNYELEIKRRQDDESATGEKHPNTSSELPSSAVNIADNQGDVKRQFSLSDTASYAEITEEQQNLYQREMRLRERKQEAVNNPELLQAMDEYSALFTEMRSLLPKRHKGTATQAELDRIEEIMALREEKMQRVADLQESLGLNAIAKEEAEIRETKESLRLAADAAWAREGAEKENKAIEKAGVPAEEYFRKKALKAFKTTTNFNEAGYMLPDGKLLNFSGGERNHRYRDHREIGEIYEATQGAAALNRFMRDGNIRIMAESPGIDLTAGVEPTKEQYAALRKFINSNGVADGQFFVDFSGAEGENVGKYAYNGKIMADRILNDIKYFFQNGKVRESSGLLDFLSLSSNDEKTASDPLTDLRLETAPVAESATTEATVSNAESVAEMFPDDTAPIQEEYEFLLAEREDIKGAMDAFAAVGNYDGAEQLMAEYEAIQTRIAEIEADDTDRLASLDEADMPPEVENAPEDVADNVPLTKTLVADLAKQVKAQLGIGNNRTAEVRELIERYSNEEFPSKAHLYTEIQERFGTITETEVDEELKNVKARLRTYGINVDESIKGEIADYAQLMRSNFGKVRFSKEGLPVDVAYAEFSEALPGYFPESIYVPTDQLMRIIEVANMDTVMETEYEIDWQTIEDVTDTIMNGVAEFKQNRKETLANKHGRESFNSLMESADQYVPPIPENVAPVRPAIQSVQADPGDIAPIFDTSSGQQSLMPEVEVPKKITRSDLHYGIMDNIKTYFKNKGFDFDKVLKDAKDLSTFATVDNTPQRVLEKALGYKEGQMLSEMTVNRVARNETDGIRWLNSFTDKKSGLLAKISKQYGIKPGSKASAAAQMYAEGFYVGENDAIIAYGDRELAADFPDKKVQDNIKKLARDPRIRQIYDETLAAINKSRTRNAYPEIPRLDNYFLHFRAMEDTFSRLGLPFNPNDIRAKDLPTDLNGVTADLKPGQPYFASAMHRTGKRTSFDLLGGLEKYLTSAKNQIYHIDDIQTFRALRNYVAETYGQANGLKDLDLLSDEEAEQRIEQVYNSHLSTFAKFLNEEANVLAGKTSLIDRGLEGVIGRRGITFLDTLNKQVGSNMVGFNVSSSLTNFLAPVQAFAKTNKFDFVKAMAQTSYNKIASVFGGGDNFAAESPVIIRRKGAERFYRTPYQKVADAGYVLMGVVDDISTELIARTKYNEFTRKGMSSNQAHYETDKWVSRLMGDRSLGQQPQLYNSKMLGLFTKFQLEVRNQLDSQFYDTIQEAKVSTEEIENRLLRNAKKAAKITSTFAQLAVMQHIFGKAFESVAGYNPAFDIIDALIKTFGWDDEEDEEDTVLDNIEEGFLSLLGDLPYTSTLNGGRIPIASALPLTELIKGEDQYGNEKNRWETLGEAAPYYLLPGGYGQLKKTKAGLEMFEDDLPIAGSYTNSGGLRFPVEDTTGNKVQAALFGQWASENARDYFDNERKPLQEKQIQELIDSDLPIRDYWDYREGLAEQENLEEKVKYIAGLDLPSSTKNILVNNLTDRKNPIDLTNYDEFATYEEFDFASKNPEKYDFLKENSVSYSDYISDEDSKEFYDGVYEWVKNYPDKVTVSKAVTGSVVEYRQYSKELDAIRADKDSNGKSISGSAKAKKLDYINGLDIDYGAKMILFKNEYNADDTYNYEIIDYLNSRDDISFDEMNTILKELGFNVTADGTITW